MVEENWLQNSDVYSLFPTLVWKIQLPRSVVATQNPVIIDLLKKINTDLADIEVAATWQSHQSLHEETELDQMMLCISGD